MKPNQACENKSLPRPNDSLRGRQRDARRECQHTQATRGHLEHRLPHAQPGKV
jgi:hypothetical protein